MEEAKVSIVNNHHNDEFSVALSRLADIENKGTVPSIYRMYSLCAIYRLDVAEVLEWYGVDLGSIGADANLVEIERTHMIGFGADVHGEAVLPLSLDPGLDVRRTTFLSRMIQRWGHSLADAFERLRRESASVRIHRDRRRSMYPVLQPGSLVLIDETRRKISTTGWANEFERPIYFIEHRSGYSCGWCSVADQQLVLQPHPSSQCHPEVYAYPGEVDVIGQVIGVAMRLDPSRRRRIRS